MTSLSHAESDVDESLVALGYMRAHLLMTEAELANAKEDLADCAARAGYTLGTVYVERLDRAPSAFEALVTHLMEHGAAAVLVPGLHHLAALGAPSVLKTHLEDTTGARVLSARHRA
jgi:hypothetical protein